MFSFSKNTLNLYISFKFIVFSQLSKNLEVKSSIRTIIKIIEKIINFGENVKIIHDKISQNNPQIHIAMLFFAIIFAY